MSDLAAGLTKLEAMRHGKRKEIDTSALMNKKVLVWDIETAPALVHTYQLKTSFIPHKAIIEPGGLLGFGYKWLDQPEDSVEWVDYRDGYHFMVSALRELLDSADFAVGMNSRRFDWAKAKGFIARLGLEPPSPPKHIDLLDTTKTFGWESASLDYSCRMMGVRRKVDNGGAGNWIGCLNDEPDAWARMEDYCKGDVLATEELYLALLPWIKGSHVGFGTTGETICPRCASTDVRIDGEYQAITTRYAAWRCNNCTGTFRSTSMLSKMHTSGTF